VSELIGTRDEGSLPPLVQQELRAAIEQLRDLAEGVHPPELEHGIPAALQALAERSPLEVAISTSVGRLHDSVEAAAYFVCAEALANVTKHAQTTSARVDATVKDGRLTLEVADLGVGAADRTGSGLRGLADRVEALGGRLVVESPPGLGTRVVAEIPCRPS
jgi:signal transduction histidine kinase